MLERIRIREKRLVLPVVLSLVAIGAVLGYAFGAPMLSKLVTPGDIPANILHLDRYTITSDSGQTSPTVLTMWLRNTGTSMATLNTLTVKDLTGGSTVSVQMNGPTVAPRGSTSTVAVDTLSSGFYFVHGHSYSFTIDTSSAQFTFSPENYP